MQRMIRANNNNLRYIIRDTLAKYGNDTDLNHIDVSGVTSMDHLFNHIPVFNGAIYKWDVSNVTNMYGMFYDSEFNGDISKWKLNEKINLLNFDLDATDKLKYQINVLKRKMLLNSL